ncbi:MAG: transposase, partial [Acidobacteriota bacterium]|nr:transposase [Acidobacteriota bacterium]
MINARDRQTGYLFDPWDHIGPKRRKLLDESWAGLFKKEILCELPVEKMAPFYTAFFGRPTKEMYTVMGVIIIQQMKDLSDDETVYQLAFNIQWHYALDIPGESDQAKYICLKTLWNERKIFTDNNLDTIVFNKITDKLAKVFSVDTTKQRIDSVHIKSNMRHLGRIGIFTRGIHKFLVNLKRQQKEQFKTLPKDIVDNYLSKNALGCFSMVKPSESKKTLDSVSKDLFELVRRFSYQLDVTAMSSYKLLLRILKEQCEVTDSSDSKPIEVSVKPSKDVSSNSLQNPSDTDAGYSAHKGQGYQVQVMETYSTQEDEEIKSQQLNLITHVEVEPACEHDSNALIPAIESTQERGLAPEEVLADSLYGSDENCETAKTKGVEVVSPAMGAPKKQSIDLDDFEHSEQGKVISCPQGHAPVKVTKSKKGRYSVAFNSDHCAKCPLINDCPVKPGKKYHYLRYTDKTLRIAKRRKSEQTAKFKERYRWRAGSEATMSEYDTRTGVKQLRVRRFKAVRFCATLKALGVNIFRATAVRKAVNTLNNGFEKETSALKHAIFVFKEQIRETLALLKNISSKFAL